MIACDFDGTLIKNSTNSALDLAKTVNKEDDANKIFSEYVSLRRSCLENSKNIEEFIEELDKILYSCVKRGAELLKGFDVSILSEKNYKLRTGLSGIISEAKKNGGIRIITTIDWRIAEKFAKENLNDYEIVGSELGSENGKLNGALSKYVGPKAKMEHYHNGDVYGNDLNDIGMFYKASKKGYNAFVVKEGKIDDDLLNAIKKFNIPVKII